MNFKTPLFDDTAPFTVVACVTIMAIFGLIDVFLLIGLRVTG